MPFSSQKTLYLRRILTAGLICGIVIDFAWIAKLLKQLHIVLLSPVLGWGLVRLAWLAYLIYGQAIALFIRYIAQKEVSIKRKNYLYLIPSLLTFFAYATYMVTHYKSTCLEQYEQYLRWIAQYYNIFFLIIPSIIYTTKTIKQKKFPRILALQIKWTLFAFLLPFVVAEIIGLLSDYSLLIGENTFNFLSTVSTACLTIGIYITGKRVFQLRFLNLYHKVSSAPRATFATEMKNISSNLDLTTSPQELHHIIKSFFKDTFSIPTTRTHFYLKNTVHSDYHPTSKDKQNIIFSFFVENEKNIVNHLKHHEILIIDELVFSNFYNHDPVQEKFINLLELINADLLLPIFKRDKIVAYIVIDRYARHSQLYSNVETDEMVVFSSCIGNLVNILQNKNLEIVAQREQAIRQQLHSDHKKLKEELYHKHQENEQYKESLRSFLRNSKQREIGILCYKNRKFSFANKAAQTVINIDLNNCPGHPLTKSVTRIAREVEEFKTAQSCILTNQDGKRIVFSAVPGLEKNGVIITAHPPEVSDLIKKEIDLLKEPRDWDYLLYLETTKSGRLINELIPGNSESILNFKTDLLKTSLGKKAVLIHAEPDDVTSLAKIMHQISLRETLHIIKLHEPSTTNHIRIKLFGANKLIYSHEQETPLLEKLDKTGTLFIENVHYLSLDAQKQLAEYILYGYFNPVHSEEKIVSDTRIICSSAYDLTSMVQDGLFDAQLYKALQKTSIKMPSLISLNNNEFKELTENIASQSIEKNKIETLINLSEKEKNNITIDRPRSLTQLQQKIKTILDRNSKKCPISYDSNLDKAPLTDPIIAEALKLGKKSLRNEKIMKALWSKFRNQAKIATLLGVNRSSVNRRCHEYKLI